MPFLVDAFKINAKVRASELVEIAREYIFHDEDKVTFPNRHILSEVRMQACCKQHTPEISHRGLIKAFAAALNSSGLLYRMKKPSLQKIGRQYTFA